MPEQYSSDSRERVPKQKEITSLVNTARYFVFAFGLLVFRDFSGHTPRDLIPTC